MNDPAQRLAFVGVICFAAWSCAAELPPPQQAAGPPPPTHALLGVLPATAVSALYLNYERLRGDWKAVLDAGASAAERRQHQGFVESEDVEHAVLAALGEGSQAQNVGVYQGRFADPALEASALAAQGDLPSYRGRRLWGRANESLGVLARNQLAMGPQQAVQAVVDVKEALAPGLVSERWYGEAHGQLSKLWPRNHNVALELLALGTSSVRERMRGFFAEAAALQWFGLRAGGQDGLHLLVVGRTASKEEASNLVFALAARSEELATKPQMRLMGISGVLEALDFRAEGTLAVIKLELTGAEWGNVRQRFAEMFAFLRKRQEAAKTP